MNITEIAPQSTSCRNQYSLDAFVHDNIRLENMVCIPVPMNQITRLLSTTMNNESGMLRVVESVIFNCRIVRFSGEPVWITMTIITCSLYPAVALHATTQ